MFVRPKAPLPSNVVPLRKPLPGPEPDSLFPSAEPRPHRCPTCGASSTTHDVIVGLVLVFALAAIGMVLLVVTEPAVLP